MSTILSSSAIADDKTFMAALPSISFDSSSASPATSRLQIVLTRFISNLLDNPYCSDGIDDATGTFDPARVRTQRTALSKALIQFNGPKKITYLIFDLDHPDSALRWQDTNAPPPNLVMVNTTNGHAHIVYELADPIWLKGKDCGWMDRPVHYMECVSKALCDTLGADQRYNGLLAKNPLHEKWRTWSFREQPYRLSELHPHIELSHHLRSRKKRDKAADGRDSALFDETRFWAYAHVNDYQNLADFKVDVTEVVERINDGFDQPFAQYSHLRSVIKSISNAVWDYNLTHGYKKTKQTRPRLSSDEIAQRQHEAGERTRQTCQADTITKLRTAIAYLVEHGLPTTRMSIAKQAGVCKRTVINYAERVAIIIRDATSLRLANFNSDSTVASRWLGYPEAGTPLAPPLPINQQPEKPANDNDKLVNAIRSSINKSQTNPKTETIVTALRNSRKPNAPTSPIYHDILEAAHGNTIKAMIVVFTHAHNGVIVADLPHDLRSSAHRLMSRGTMSSEAATPPPLFNAPARPGSIFRMWNEPEIDDPIEQPRNHVRDRP